MAAAPQARVFWLEPNFEARRNVCDICDKGRKH